jgi:hypothetical protein
MGRPAAAALTLAVAVLLPSAAHGQGYDGEWRAGPRRYQVSVQSWGPDCGPRPGGSSTGGGAVTIAQSGDHLVFSGAVRGSTNGCWTPNREVRRSSSQASGGSWTTRCATASDNPRRERGTYTFTGGGGSLSFREETRVDWQLNESRCIATITSSRSFSRAAAGEETTEEPARPACTPGEPARLVLRPARLALEPGDRQCVRAAVVDAAGCEVPRQPVTWQLVAPEGRRAVLRSGCFEAAPTAAEAEGRFRVLAQSDALRAEASVVVQTRDLSDLVAHPSEEAGSGGGAEGEARSTDATGISARGVSGATDAELLYIVLGAAAVVALLLALVVMMLARRRRDRTVAELAADGDTDPAPPPTPPPRTPATARPVPAGGDTRAPLGRLCPVCGTEYSGETLFCAGDGARLVAQGAPAARGGQGMICPVCRRGYPPEARFCPHDSEELMPYGLYAARARQELEGGEHTKICPKCGDRYPISTQFCGKDGSELALVN